MPANPTPWSGNFARGLLVLGTALTILWQPLARQAPLKASDILFALALACWTLFLLREKSARRLDVGGVKLALPLLALLGSLLTATLIGYVHYGLTMSRDGLVLLVRLGICMALFFATYQFSRTGDAFIKWISLVLLSPTVLFPAMLVPGLSASMWWDNGRFRGLTVNPNTAAIAFSIALAVAYVLAVHEMKERCLWRASAFTIVAASMLFLILWTQSRAYLLAALASILLGAALTASTFELPKFRTAAITVLVFLAIVTTNVFLTNRSSMNTYLARFSFGVLSGVTTPSSKVAPSSGRQVPTSSVPQVRGPSSDRAPILGRPSFGRHKIVDSLARVPNKVVRRLIANPHVQAALFYAELLPTTPLGLGVNYEEKFFIYFPWINEQHHGTNSILDVPIYGGVGAVLSLGFLALLIVKNTRHRLKLGMEATTPYTLGAITALAGLWMASIPLGSPIFDYQFWIVTAIALT